MTASATASTTQGTQTQSAGGDGGRVRRRVAACKAQVANWGCGAGRGNAEGGEYQHPNFARSALRLLCFPRTRTGFKLEMA